MRIGLYGLPSAGKTFVLEGIKNFEAISGSACLLEIAPDFHYLNEPDKKRVRQKLAESLTSKDNFMMDGHYSFGEDVAFTEEDGNLYDTFLYLYVDPEILLKRMKDSVKNRKYAGYDIKVWQEFEIDRLRAYCHEHNKDFYVIDNPEKGCFYDVSIIHEFINSLAAGFSCIEFAKECARKILSETEDECITLLDGDKTLTLEDSSGQLGYMTHLFDNNFYTGFQSWRHNKEFAEFIMVNDIHVVDIDRLGIHFNDRVINSLNGKKYILTSGFYEVWNKLAQKLNIPFFYGNMMSAESKLYIVKMLQDNGKYIKAYGDSMNDYFMLKQANEGFLVAKLDGTLSRSLKGKDMEGITIV